MKKILLFLFSILYTNITFSQQVPKDPVIQLVEVGFELHQAADYREAIQKYKEALDLDPKSFLANAEIATSYKWE